MGKFVKRFFIAFVILINLLVIVRVIIASDKSVYKNLALNESLALEYDRTGSVDVLSHKVEGDLAVEGLFAAYSLYYLPESSEVQITVRYNKSAYKYAEVDESKPLDFRLYNSDTKKYYDGECLEEKKRLMYTFKKYTFKDVEFEPTENNLNVLMSVDGGVYDEMIVHYKEQEFEEYKLSKSEKKELSEMAGSITDK